MRRRRSTAVLVLAALAMVSALAGVGILVVSGAHGHGLTSGDRNAVLVSAVGSIACLVAAGWLYRSR